MHIYAEPTGVRSSGVEMGELSLFSLIPLPRSKSQIFTGEIWKGKRGKLFQISQVIQQMTFMSRALWPRVGCLPSSQPETLFMINQALTMVSTKVHFRCAIMQSLLLDRWKNDTQRLTLCSCSHKMFSGLRSLWAIPARYKHIYRVIHQFSRVMRIRRDYEWDSRGRWEHQGKEVCFQYSLLPGMAMNRQAAHDPTVFLARDKTWDSWLPCYSS